MIVMVLPVGVVGGAGAGGDRGVGRLIRLRSSTTRVHGEETVPHITCVIVGGLGLDQSNLDKTLYIYKCLTSSSKDFSIFCSSLAVSLLPIPDFTLQTVLTRISSQSNQPP